MSDDLTEEDFAALAAASFRMLDEEEMNRRPNHVHLRNHIVDVVPEIRPGRVQGRFS
jgi:hypothetical protein